MQNPKGKKCPRCKSKRLEKRLSGENYCKRCGQRWANHGLLIPSFDKRKITETKQFPEDPQLSLIPQSS